MAGDGYSFSSLLPALVAPGNTTLWRQPSTPVGDDSTVSCPAGRAINPGRSFRSVFFYREADDTAPLSPGAIIYPYLVDSENVAHGKPGQRGAVTQSAVGDNFAVSPVGRVRAVRRRQRRDGPGQDGAQLDRRQEGIILVDQFPEEQVNRTGNTTGAFGPVVKSGRPAYPLPGNSSGERTSSSNRPGWPNRERISSLPTRLESSALPGR